MIIFDILRDLYLWNSIKIGELANFSLQFVPFHFKS